MRRQSSVFRLFFQLFQAFQDKMNFSMGSRPSVLGELERYVEQTYGKAMYFKARLRETGERIDTRYVSDEELKENIHMEISIEE